MSEFLSSSHRLSRGPDESWFLNMNPGFNDDQRSKYREIVCGLREQLLAEPYLYEDEVRATLGVDDVSGFISAKELLAYRDHGDLLVPVFQFEPLTGKLRHACAVINQLLGYPTDHPDATIWWLQGNGYLENHMAPKELLGTVHQYALRFLLQADSTNS